MLLLHFTRKKQTAALTAARKKQRETTEYSELKSAQQPKRLPVTGRVSAAPPLFGAARCGRIDRRLGRPALSMQGPSATRPGVLHPRPEPDPRRCSRLPSKKRRPLHNHNQIQQGPWQKPGYRRIAANASSILVSHCC